METRHTYLARHERAKIHVKTGMFTLTAAFERVCTLGQSFPIYMFTALPPPRESLDVGTTGRGKIRPPLRINLFSKSMLYVRPLATSSQSSFTSISCWGMIGLLLKLED